MVLDETFSLCRQAELSLLLKKRGPAAYGALSASFPLTSKRL